jgi:hypothetical protein
VGIHRLLHSSFCFLNINTAITRQLIRTVRTLEAEWSQVCGEAWVRGRRKMNQVLGAFGLLHFTMLRPVLAWRALWNVWTVYFFNFLNFFFGGRGQPRILENADTESVDTAVHLYIGLALTKVHRHFKLNIWKHMSMKIDWIYVEPKMELMLNWKTRRRKMHEVPPFVMHKLFSFLVPLRLPANIPHCLFMLPVTHES